MVCAAGGGWQVAEKGCTGLADLGPVARGAARALVKLLYAEKGWHEPVLTALIRISPRLAWAVPQIAMWLEDGHHPRPALVHLLGQVGPKAARAVPALRRLIELPADSQKDSRYTAITACRALWRILGPDDAAVANLAALAADGDRWVAWKAARTLSRLTPATDEAYAALERLLRSSHRCVCHEARTGLLASW